MVPSGRAGRFQTSRSRFPFARRLHRSPREIRNGWQLNSEFANAGFNRHGHFLRFAECCGALIVASAIKRRCGGVEKPRHCPGGKAGAWVISMLHVAILVVSPTVGSRGRLPAGFNFSVRAHMKAFVVEGILAKAACTAPPKCRDPIIGPRDVLVRVSAASINPLDKMVRNGEFRAALEVQDTVRARTRRRGRRDAGRGRRAGLPGRRRGLRPTSRPAYRDLRGVHCHRPCGHRPQAEVTHDGRICSGPAGGACRVAGAGRPRAGRGGAEGPCSRRRGRTGLDRHTDRQAPGRTRCHNCAR